MGGRGCPWQPLEGALQKHPFSLFGEEGSLWPPDSHKHAKLTELEIPKGGKQRKKKRYEYRYTEGKLPISICRMVAHGHLLCTTNGRDRCRYDGERPSALHHARQRQRCRCRYTEGRPSAAHPAKEKSRHNAQDAEEWHLASLLPNKTKFVVTIKHRNICLCWTQKSNILHGNCVFRKTILYPYWVL